MSHTPRLKDVVKAEKSEVCDIELSIDLLKANQDLAEENEQFLLMPRCTVQNAVA